MVEVALDVKSFVFEVQGVGEGSELVAVVRCFWQKQRRQTRRRLFFQIFTIFYERASRVAHLAPDPACGSFSTS